MIKWMNRNLYFEKKVRNRFLRRFINQLDNNVPSAKLLQITLETAKDAPVKELMKSSIPHQEQGKPWALDWAVDGYFTEEDALKLSIAQEQRQNEGFRQALQQILDDSEESVGFWWGIFKDRKISSIAGLLVGFIFYYLTKAQGATLAIPFVALGGDVNETLLMKAGFVVTEVIPISFLCWLVVLMGYRKVREAVVNEETRSKFKKFGFFQFYDRIFEYRVVSTIGNLLELGQNTTMVLDSLQQIYRTPYEQYRVGLVVSRVTQESKTLLEALRGNVLRDSTYKLIKFATPKEDNKMLASSFKMTSGDLKEDLLGSYEKLDSIPLFITFILITALVLGIITLNISIQEAVSAAEARALSR